MAKLIAQSGHSLELPKRRVTLGEASACDIPLATGLGLAGRHFEIEPDAEGNYIVRDVSGGAGTLVNGEPVQEQVLRHGNVIMAGGLRLGFWDTTLPEQEESPFLAGARRNAKEEPPSPAAAPELPAPAPVPTTFQSAAPIPESPVAEPTQIAECSLPPIPEPPQSGEGPPTAWVAPAEIKHQNPSGQAAAPDPSPADRKAGGKRPRVWSQSHRKIATRRMMMIASIILVGGVAIVVSLTEPVQKAMAPYWAKVTGLFSSTKAPSRAPAVPVPDDSGKVTVAANPSESITPKTNHNEVVKRMLTERTLTLFQADLTQLVPFYNASAGARNLPPQREMTEAFRKHYGILLDGFDRLTCLQARGKDEFVFVLSSSTRVNIQTVLGIPPPPAKDSAGAKGKKATRIYPVKTTGRVYGVAQYDPFTVILGNQSWIDTSLNGTTGPSLREALVMFPDTASRNPGALIMVERIVPPGENSPRSAFQTAVSNLFFKGKGESRLTLTRNPDVKESLFVEQSSAALKEQASSLIQAVRVSEALMVGGIKPAPESAPGDSGEIITTAEASILIPDGEALLREAIDSVAHTFMSQSPSVELILAAQKAVLNFNQARLKQAPEAQSVTSVAEALELLQNGISVRGLNNGPDRVYQIDRLEANQADEIVHLLAMEDKAGLVFRPNSDHLSGTLLDLAVKARDYRNAELLISLWTAARFTDPDAADVNAAVRKVMNWATNEGSRQRISVGLPSLTAEEYKNAVALLSIQNGQLTWKPGEEGYRTWLRRMSPDPKADAKRIAGAYDNARKTGAIPSGKVESLADAVVLINSGMRTAGGTRTAYLSAGHLTIDELRAAARYLRYESGALRVVDR